MEIMIRATLTVTQNYSTGTGGEKTGTKGYGFSPDAGEQLKKCFSSRYTQAQALRILGVSRTKFTNDRKAGKVKQNGTEEKPWFKGMDLYQYWWNETKGYESEDYIKEQIRTRRQEHNRRLERNRKTA